MTTTAQIQGESRPANRLNDRSSMRAASPIPSAGESSGAFPDLLSVASKRFNAPMIGNEDASPERMFEPKEESPRARRAQDARDTDRARIADDANMRQDRRVGTEARKELKQIAAAHEATRASRSDLQMAGRSDAFASDLESLLQSRLSSSGESGKQQDFRPPVVTPHAMSQEVWSRTSGHAENKTAFAEPHQFPSGDSVSFGRGAAQGRQAAALESSGGRAGTAASELARMLAGVRGSDTAARDVPAASTLDAGNRSVSRESSKSAPEKSGNGKNESQEMNARKAEEPTGTPFARLVRLLRTQTDRQSSARVMLDPPELGRIQVRIKMNGDRVDVGVETETSAARDLVRSRAEQLKSSLEQGGLVVNRFEIQTNVAGLFDIQPIQRDRRRSVAMENLRPTSFIAPLGLTSDQEQSRTERLNNAPNAPTSRNNGIDLRV